MVKLVLVGAHLNELRGERLGPATAAAAAVDDEGCLDGLHGVGESVP